MTLGPLSTSPASPRVDAPVTVTDTGLSVSVPTSAPWALVCAPLILTFTSVSTDGVPASPTDSIPVTLANVPAPASMSPSWAAI